MQVGSRIAEAPEGGRPPLVGTKAGESHLGQFEQVERFVLGGDHLPACQRRDDAPYFQMRRMGVPAAMQLAAEHLRVQTKCLCQLLLGIAACTKIRLYAVAKCPNTHVYATAHACSS